VEGVKMCLAVPGLIVNVLRNDEPFVVGAVEFAGVRRSVNLACVPEAKVGDYVLVHAGVAITVINEEEAEKVLRELTAIGSMDEFDGDDRDGTIALRNPGAGSPLIGEDGVT
jgi:hydrogenase expression/formation protein HypC